MNIHNKESYIARPPGQAPTLVQALKGRENYRKGKFSQGNISIIGDY
jgi:hypothetical protein